MMFYEYRAENKILSFLKPIANILLGLYAAILLKEKLFNYKGGVEFELQNDV